MQYNAVVRANPTFITQGSIYRGDMSPVQCESFLQDHDTLMEQSDIVFVSCTQVVQRPILKIRTATSF